MRYFAIFFSFFVIATLVPASNATSRRQTEIADQGLPSPPTGIQEFMHITSVFGGAKHRFLDIMQGRLEQTKLDFWKVAESLGLKLQEYADTLLHEAEEQVSEASSSIRDVKHTMDMLVSSADQFHHELFTDTKGDITVESLAEDFERALTPVLDKLRDMFPPPDEAPHHHNRNEAVHRVLEMIEDALVSVGSEHGMDGVVLRQHIDNMKPHIQKLVVLVGDLSEQHPILRDTLVFTVVALLIPESWILRPILRVFGFGTGGPVKGSAAAWSQRYFFGAAVKEGSWFSHLQRAGMTIISPGIGKKIIGGIGAGIGLGYSAWRC